MPKNKSKKVKKDGKTFESEESLRKYEAYKHIHNLTKNNKNKKK